MASSLNIEKISKSFERVTALKDVSLAVRPGEFCVLVGPSGCGKSTLLQIIAGLEHQDSGSILMDGRSIDHLEPRDRDVAMVFQSYALYPHMSVFDNLAFGLRMRKVPVKQIPERVMATAALLDIEGLLDRKPRQLSGGQRQRVAMGRALVRRPRIFLFDEPLSNLDARLRVSVRVELKRLHQEIQGTMVYVTHDQIEAMTLGDKVAVMQSGRIHQIGTPEEVYGSPADIFVATFIGSPAMNLINGHIEHRAGQFYFNHPDFNMDLDLWDGLSLGEAVLGIRPEDMRIVEAVHGFPGSVEIVSNLGSDQYLHLKSGELELTARAPKGVSFHSQAQIKWCVAQELCHLFADGKRVPLKIEAGS
ncbi:MAG TPA: ABC transporter ATP-binding protein [Desulfobacteraceae bacterium]|nr:ABC transporter ATP-binding protein [Desulfobacteraceae bacterium]HPJ66961.1 ABC transporter ATP-binding protein [Desulfobacteraceae bacterium]HPQ27697.1 ABC transporter ATP-binding protein [Desulfobacteraceae bacterium]